MSCATWFSSWESVCLVYGISVDRFPYPRKIHRNFGAVTLVGNDLRSQHRRPCPLDRDVEPRHHAVIDEPLKRLGEVIGCALQRFGGLFRALEQPDSGSDLVVGAFVSNPSARIVATVWNHVIRIRFAVGEDADQNCRLEIGARLQISTGERPVAAAEVADPYGGDVAHWNR